MKLLKLVSVYFSKLSEYFLRDSCQDFLCEEPFARMLSFTSVIHSICVDLGVSLHVMPEYPTSIFCSKF